MVKTELPEAIRITLTITGSLERLQVPYVVGGSLASSLYGVPRATNDVDIIAAFRSEHVAPFLADLGEAFYADEDMIRDTIQFRGSFNIIELQTMFKIDVFVPLMDIVIRKELARGQRVVVDQENNLALILASPEDTVVQKLKWYKEGGSTSERQLQDALGVLVSQAKRLDRTYLEETAQLLDVEALLKRLLEEAELQSR